VQHQISTRDQVDKLYLNTKHIFIYLIFAELLCFTMDISHAGEVGYCCSCPSVCLSVRLSVCLFLFTCY